MIEDQLTDGLAGASADVDAGAALMLRFQQGEEACFDALVLRYQRPLTGYMLRLVRHPGVSEELVQDVFLRVYRSRERYRPQARFTTWLYRIATHLALNYLRDHRAEAHQASLDEPETEGGHPPDAVDGRPGIETRLMRREWRRRVQQAIASLPERQRAAVILHKYQEMEYREIAQALQLSVSATKSLLFRAYEVLRGQLEQLEAMPG